MSVKCRICGINPVPAPGDICSQCNNSSGNKPKRKVLLNGGAELSNCDPYGNNMGSGAGAPGYAPPVAPPPAPPVTPPPVAPTPPAFYGGNAPVQAAPAYQSRQMPVCSGVVRNVSRDYQKRAFIYKWFRALFGGVPYTLDDEATLFQVYPVNTPNGLNSMGNACDLVAVYGQVSNGSINNGDMVDVYGQRDSKNRVIARKVMNNSSGCVVTGARSLGVVPVLIITLLVIALLAGLVVCLGPTGILCSAILIIIILNLPRIIKFLAIVLGLKFIFGGRK